MPQEFPAPSSPSQDIHAYLHAISSFLRRPHRLDAVAQDALADLVDELDNAIRSGKIPNDEATKLAATLSHFADAIQREEEPGVLKAARERLMEATVVAENHAPMVAGLARRFMDALANIGI